MKYIAVLDTDDYKDFKFFEDSIGKYMVGKDANATANGWIPLFFTECEQEPILDKIRAEIEEEYNRLSATRADETLELGECLGLKMSLKIINKYRVESEE